ncbi:MAG: hypothetical protein M1838_003279 [Thelocarpon superellum]|nr:MAG: hypothetical protein M1838_003279 [Thelocarpon superellum]
MSAPKVVVVFGATGVQGGSVITALLADARTATQFKLRGITRDPSKPNAQALAAKGVECVTADLDSKDSLLAAFKDAYAVFAVTNYWEKMDAKLEERQGRNVADVCKDAGVQHLIWSSLINVAELSKGKFSEVYHFDSKANIEEYIRSIGIPATYVLPGFYMSNFSSWLYPNPQSEAHELVLSLPMPPDTPIPLLDTAGDMGKFVKAALLNREKTLGKQLLAAAAYYTPEQILSEFAALKPVTGKGAHFVQNSHDAFKSVLASAGMPPLAQEELAQNMEFMHDFGYYGKASLSESLQLLGEPATSWTEFMAKDAAYKQMQ